MVWNNEKDIMLMREMLGQDIFVHKAGSRERGNIWQLIATTLNSLEGFTVTSRSCRDHFLAISRKYTVQNNKDERLTGVGGDELGEFETLIGDLIQQSKESDEKIQNDAENKNADRETAIEMRKTAMERIGQTRKRECCSDSSSARSEDNKFDKKTRRNSSDTLDFLREKLVADKAQHAAEQESKQQERQQFNNILQTFQNSMQQQQEQSNQAQQQILMLMNQQQQLMQLFMNNGKK